MLVLYSALLTTQDERVQEAALMRALGASRAQISAAQQAEFIALGLLAGLLASAGACAVGAMLAIKVFQFDYVMNPWVWIAGPLLGLGCVALNVLGGRAGCAESPAAVGAARGLEKVLRTGLRRSSKKTLARSLALILGVLGLMLTALVAAWRGFGTDETTRLKLLSTIELQQLASQLKFRAAELDSLRARYANDFVFGESIDTAASGSPRKDFFECGARARCSFQHVCACMRM